MAILPYGLSQDPVVTHWERLHLGESQFSYHPQTVLPVGPRLHPAHVSLGLSPTKHSFLPSSWLYPVIQHRANMVSPPPQVSSCAPGAKEDTWLPTSVLPASHAFLWVGHGLMAPKGPQGGVVKQDLGGGP